MGFVASGDLGNIIASSNGTSWSARNSGVSDWLYSVRYLNGIYLAVGENGRILTSPDSINWTPRNSGTTLWLNDSAYVNGAWYIAANSGTVLSSTDSINWTLHPAISAKTLNSIVARGTQLIAAGLEGTILRADFSPPQSPVEILGYNRTDGVNLFLFQGELDQRFLLQSKSSLSDPWTTHSALELVHPEGSFIYETPIAPGSSRFFRTLLLQD